MQAFDSFSLQGLFGQCSNGAPGTVRERPLPESGNILTNAVAGSVGLPPDKPIIVSRPADLAGIPPDLPVILNEPRGAHGIPRTGPINRPELLAGREFRDQAVEL